MAYTNDTWCAKRISADAVIPVCATSGSAGYDLVSIEEKTLKCGGFGPVAIGWKFALPSSCFGRISPRSGLALKGIDVLAGIVDNDYRGEVKVILINHGKEPLNITKGMKIAQLVLHRLHKIAVQEVSELDNTVRGEGGFGSTDKNPPPSTKSPPSAKSQSH
jgi:dUTP pyrophosphatase